ncbi:unnamed protein product [Chrysoparadoxa australica]
MRWDLRDGSVPRDGAALSRSEVAVVQDYLHRSAPKVCIFGLAHSDKDPHKVLVGGSCEHLIEFDLRNAERPCQTYCPEHLKGSDEHITGVAVNHTGNMAVVTYNDEDVYTIAREGTSMQEDDEGYVKRFSGHRNRQTVKQVNFFGHESDYVVSGSDCGHVFLWETATAELSQVFKADCIGAVNCLEPHPTMPILATSGLQHEAKLWAPTGIEEAVRTDPDQLRRSNQEARERGLPQHIAAWLALHAVPLMQGGSSTSSDGAVQETSSEDEGNSSMY